MKDKDQSIIKVEVFVCLEHIRCNVKLNTEIFSMFNLFGFRLIKISSKASFSRMLVWIHEKVV